MPYGLFVGPLANRMFQICIYHLIYTRICEIGLADGSLSPVLSWLGNRKNRR